MAQYTTPSQLSGLFKEAYGDDIIDLIPESAKLVKMIPFVSRDKETGNKYHQPIIVQQEQGVTYAAADAGAFALEDSIAMAMKDAQVQGAQMLLRSAISYDAAAKASNSKKAFVKSTELLVDNMLESLTKRLEICLLHGQDGIGVKQASSTNDSATKETITVSAASFAAGIWSGLESAKVQFFLTSNGSLVSSGADAVFTIDAVDVDNREITVTGTSGGITALGSAGEADIYFKGSRTDATTYNEMAGLKRIFTNTGELFNVNAGTYNLWKGNSVTVSGQLTIGKVLNAISKAVQRGLNEDVVLVVNPDTWSNLASDLAALRQFDGSYDHKKGENGFNSLCYYGQNGKIEILSHNLCKAGQAFVFPPKRAKRIGSQEVSFKTPGREEEVFLQLSNNAGFEMRIYSDQALFVETPARCVYISGFTNA